MQRTRRDAGVLVGSLWGAMDGFYTHYFVLLRTTPYLGSLLRIYRVYSVRRSVTGCYTLVACANFATMQVHTIEGDDYLVVSRAPRLSLFTTVRYL